VPTTITGDREKGLTLQQGEKSRPQPKKGGIERRGRRLSRSRLSSVGHFDLWNVGLLVRRKVDARRW
jgi:hypothetical protein